LRGIRELTKKYRVLLIADEVATGFGRTGRMFACEHEAISPDLLCLAKGITGGYLPLAATLTTEEIFNAFLGEYEEKKTFYHGHSYTGNPLACAAAVANLKVMKEERVLEKLQGKIQFLSEALKRYRELEHVGDIRQLGMMVGIELVVDKTTKEEYPFEDKIGIKVIKEARRRGLILRPLGNVIVLMPPLGISPDELNEILSITYHSIKTVTGSG
jgi:adenosylmethionine-8-amino-7-oxononanoate aminotransferase